MKWKCPERHKSLKSAEGETESLNRPLTKRDLFSHFRLSTQKTPGSHAFTGEFYQTFEEELMPVLHKLFPRGQHYPKAKTKGLIRKSETNILHDYSTKNLHEILAH